MGLKSRLNYLFALRSQTSLNLSSPEPTNGRRHSGAKVISGLGDLCQALPSASKTFTQRNYARGQEGHYTPNCTSEQPPRSFQKSDLRSLHSLNPGTLMGLTSPTWLLKALVSGLC